MFDIREELKRLPERPGVYIMRDNRGEIIYIGKAAVLKNRVRQYFQSSGNMNPRIQMMVSRVHKFEYIVTDSELEALILECNLIKKHRPRFNVLLKDDKTYPYIKVTMNEEFPRIILTRKHERDGAKYFGPYPDGSAVKKTLDVVRKVFPVRSCRKVLPKDIGKSRPCLNYHIYQCLAPCQGSVDKEKYREMMKDVCAFLGGKQDELMRKLEKNMNEAAERWEFEKAADIRDKINSIKVIAEKQKVVSESRGDSDVVALARDGADAYIQMFFIRNGKLMGKHGFFLENADGVEEKDLLGSFIKQFYDDASYVPEEVILQSEPDGADIIREWLSGRRGSKVQVRAPKRGEGAQLVKMVLENAQLALNSFKECVQRENLFSQQALEQLKEILKLDKKPHRIEVYDISNTGASEMVASMVVFEDGRLNRKEYRKFRIKSLERQNDYGAMQEVIFRRFKRAEKDMAAEGKTQGKFAGAQPDLILVDGGKGHVSAVSEVLKEVNRNVPVWGMVKDDRRRTRALVSQDREVELAGGTVLVRLIAMAQEEAHRFAVRYNRGLREKRYSSSVLDEIEGIGPARKKALLKHFGSIDRIKEAGVDELEKIEGMNISAAKNVYEFFH